MAFDKLKWELIGISPNYLGMTIGGVHFSVHYKMSRNVGHNSMYSLPTCNIIKLSPIGHLYMQIKVQFNGSQNLKTYSKIKTKPVYSKTIIL